MTKLPTFKQLYRFIDDLERSLGYDPGLSIDCDNVVLCGVGGSAVSGYFVADCCMTKSLKPVRLVRYPGLPSWAGVRTLAVISSYSGNTAETMEMYREARIRGCSLVIVTSGGELRAVTEADGYHLVLLPEGLHPRHAIGYMIGFTLAVLRFAGCPDISYHIRGFVPSLREFRDTRAVPERCEARKLAGNLIGKVPVVCSDSSMASVAFRWKTQLNENSKMVAFCESFPLFGASALNGWLNDVHQNYELVFLMGDDPRYKKLRDAAEAAKRAGCGVTVVELGGRTQLEDMFRAIILGDYVSVYIANLRGIDPAEVPPVIQMKAKLSLKIRGFSEHPRPLLQTQRSASLRSLDSSIQSRF